MFGAAPAGNGPWEQDRETMFPTPTFSIGRYSTTIRPLPANRIGIASLPAIRPAIQSRRISVGPVAVNCRTLVDECRDLSLTTATDGKVSTASENARTVQEDCHRLVLKPGSSIVYRVDGPISAFRVYAFAPTQANLAFDVSADGKTYTNRSLSGRHSPPAKQSTDTLTPILFSGDLERGRADVFANRVSRTARERKRTGEDVDIEIRRRSRTVCYRNRIRPNSCKGRIDSRRCEGARNLTRQFSSTVASPIDDALAVDRQSRSPRANGRSMSSSPSWSI